MLLLIEALGHTMFANIRIAGGRISLSPPIRSGRRAAFTLVELRIVIAVIVILLALLLPHNPLVTSA